MLLMASCFISGGASASAGSSDWIQAPIKKAAQDFLRIMLLKLPFTWTSRTSSLLGSARLSCTAAHVWGSAPVHAGITIETLTEIALRLAANSGSFCGDRFALRHGISPHRAQSLPVITPTSTMLQCSY